MENVAETLVATRREGILRVIQKRLADQFRTPFETLYRRFRPYLWGSAHAFVTRPMDAYRVVLERQ